MAGRPTVADTAAGLAQQEHEAYAQPQLALIEDPNVEVQEADGGVLRVFVEGHRIGSVCCIRDVADSRVLGWQPIGSLCIDSTCRTSQEAVQVLVRRWRALTWRMSAGQLDEEDKENLIKKHRQLRTTGTETLTLQGL